jgi:ABC-type transport system involved in multi-copper enzyme maturation permease subunit
MGAGWLILLVYAVLGFCLTVVLRSSGGAIAVGLVYVLIFEPLLSGILGSSQNLQWVAAAVPGQAVSSLRATMEGALEQSTLSLSNPVSAAMLLSAWAVFLGLISLLVFTRRDIR